MSERSPAQSDLVGAPIAVNLMRGLPSLPTPALGYGDDNQYGRLFVFCPQPGTAVLIAVRGQMPERVKLESNR